MFNATGLNAQTVANNVQSILVRYRDAQILLNDMYNWSNGVSNSDLVAIGFSSADATTLQAALADAHAEYLIHTTGLPPVTYPQPASAYVYAASQNEVIGPQ